MKSYRDKKINKNKSCFLVDKRMIVEKKHQISQISGFSAKAFLVKYLGCPLYIGRRKSEYFADIAQSILFCIMTWKSRLLSLGGKITLIKHVLASIPIHLLSAANPTKRTLNIIERSFARFLWGLDDEVNKHHWLKWVDLCYLREEGGIGFWLLSDIHASLH